MNKMKEWYYLKKLNGEKVWFEFNYGGFKLAQKYIVDHEDELEHPFNDERVTIYYKKGTRGE